MLRLLVFLLLVPGQAWALSGSELVSLCANEKTTDYCLGYLMGADDALSRFSCPPPKRTASQTSMVVGAFMGANSTRLHELASDLILEAFVKAFPCPSK